MVDHAGMETVVLCTVYPRNRWWTVDHTNSPETESINFFSWTYMRSQKFQYMPTLWKEPACVYFTRSLQNSTGISFILSFLLPKHCFPTILSFFDRKQSQDRISPLPCALCLCHVPFALCPILGSLIAFLMFTSFGAS